MGQAELKIKMNPDGSHYLKFNFTNQVWLPYNQSNPGTTALGERAPHTFDISLRRTRMQFLGQRSSATSSRKDSRVSWEH